MSDVTALPTKPVLTIPETAAFLGWDERKCYREAKRYLDTDGAEGVIPAHRSGRSLRVPVGLLKQRLGMAS